MRDRRAAASPYGLERDRLKRHLPDREDCAQDEEQVDGALECAAFFLFRTNQHSVGGVRDFAVGVDVFHWLLFVAAKSICTARAMKMGVA